MKLGASLALVLASLTIGNMVKAQERTADWPSRPVKLIVPFGPGSTPDLLARVVGDKLGSTLKQAFVVENRSGAGGNIGTHAVARAAADGYTIGVSITGPLVNNTVLYSKLPYDPFKDLLPVTLAAIQPNVLAVSSTLGVNNAAEFFKMLHANPGKYNYASVGAGTVSHLSMELIKSKTGVYIVHIPYAASPAAVTSVLSGDTQMASLAPAAVIPQIKAGKMVAIAVTTERRYADLPDVPTFKEMGIPDVIATAWIGIVVPAHTPTELVQRINEAFVAALQDPIVSDKLRAQHMQTVGNSQQQFADFMRQELTRWSPIIKRAGVTLD
jgi:tripartite-type tricarboxylate transporter receptor subunit TctC